MAKQKSAFFCSNCGAETTKWFGKCTSCGEWNTYIEEPVIKTTKSVSGKTRETVIPKLVSEINISSEPRLNSKSV